MLKGYKTYLFAAALAGIAALHYLGYISDEAAKTLEAIFAGGGLAALRSAVASK